MQPWDAYLIYNALKLHFTSDSYDAVKYGYKTSARPKSFLKRKDKYSFAKLARKYPNREQLIDFIVANCIATSDNLWVGDMANDGGDDVYLDWCKKRDGIYYHFQSDVDKLVDHCIRNGLKFDDLLAPHAPHPRIAELCLSGEISIETLTLIDTLVDFMASSKVTETIVWPDFSRKVRKYRVFWTWVDRNKLKKILLDGFTSVQSHGTIQPTQRNTTQYDICHSQI
jgi:hypothetical protein